VGMKPNRQLLLTCSGLSKVPVIIRWCAGSCSTPCRNNSRCTGTARCAGGFGGVHLPGNPFSWHPAAVAQEPRNVAPKISCGTGHHAVLDSALGAAHPNWCTAINSVQTLTPKWALLKAPEIPSLAAPSRSAETTPETAIQLVRLMAQVVARAKLATPAALKTWLQLSVLEV
jgi:hypothetical protein